MLKLIYDVKCGFKELYMTAKNQELDLLELWLSALHEKFLFEDTYTKPTEETLFNELKDLDQAELEEAAVYNGVLNKIETFIKLDYANRYFKSICLVDTNCKIVPSYIKIYNLRVVKETTIKVYCDSSQKEEIRTEFYRAESGLKAKDVMAILGVSRQTVSNYVKTGKLKVTSRYAGGQYTYDYDSVMKLKEGSK